MVEKESTDEEPQPILPLHTASLAELFKERVLAGVGGRLRLVLPLLLHVQVVAGTLRAASWSPAKRSLPAVPHLRRPVEQRHVLLLAVGVIGLEHLLEQGHLLLLAAVQQLRLLHALDGGDDLVGVHLARLHDGQHLAEHLLRRWCAPRPAASASPSPD
ncbi:hypothetical protein TYRP_014702 [Tyrophagus putrescentiae]|nr:hypothetical protein TYRP_014702 [Tyrophagus putrescentiae]